MTSSLGSRSSRMSKIHVTWCPHQMETFSALLALCMGNSLITSEFPAQRPVTRSFDFFLWSAPSINDRVNYREAGDLRRHRAHYDVIVMSTANLRPGIGKCNSIHCCQSASSSYERIHKDSWLTYRKWLSHHLINPYFEISNSPQKRGNMKSDAHESFSKIQLVHAFYSQSMRPLLSQKSSHILDQ